MKAKKYLLGIFLFLFAPSFAQQVSLETAQCVADIFLRNNMSAAMRSASATHITTSSASVIKPIGKVAQSPVMYAVSQDSVWVLISADERVTPILAYSDANAGTFPEYNDMPEGMIALLDWYEEQIQYLRDSTNITTVERKRNARKNAHEMHDYTRGDSREHITDERNEENLRAEPQSKTNKCPNEIRG